MTTSSAPVDGAADALQVLRNRTFDEIAIGCWRRFKIEPPCRLNFEPGLMANL